jgi:hypothetical protein
VLTATSTSGTFDGQVLGIIYKDPADPYGNPSLPFYPLFTASNFLGASGTTYALEGASACGPYCGFETKPAPDMDMASINGNVASFHNFYSTPGNFARIITADPPRTSSRSHRWRWTSRSDLGARWPARLVATAAESRLSFRRRNSHRSSRQPRQVSRLIGCLLNGA